MPESSAEKSTQGGRTMRRILREMRIPLIMLIPSILFWALCISAQQTLNKNSYDNLTYEIENYYFSGWPVENLLYQIEKLTPGDTREIASLTRDLNYIYDRDLSEITERIRSTRTQASVLYIDKIAQPTDHLEELYDELSSGIELENYEIISASLFDISIEIDHLRQEQADDISYMADTTAHAIESINTVGYMYGLTLDEYVESAQDVIAASSNDLVRYTSLLPIKREAAKLLDEKIVARGGEKTDGKRILISISRQKLFMIEDYNIIYEMPASTGVSGHGTAAGEFQIYSKVDMAWGYYHIWMPYWMTIYYSGNLENGIHGIPISPVRGRWEGWDRAVGNYPITYGCVMPHDWDAEVVYTWAEIGIPVSIVY